MGSPLPASPARVADALTLLRGAPTRAAVATSTGELATAALEGWHEVTELTQAPFVARLAAAYSAGLSTRHLAVGGACGLQHYAGRFVLAALGTWVQTGCLPDLDHRAWRVELDEHGHTLTVAPPLAGAVVVTEVDDLAEAVLGTHLEPIIAAVREATPITRRVALGCVAASCSGAFATLHRRTAPERQEDVAELAARFLAAPAWRVDRPLVDLHEIAVPAGPALVHERRVCCLIRLGEGHGACGTCPDIDPAERTRRITEHATTAARGHDLPLGALHVP